MSKSWVVLAWIGGILLSVTVAWTVAKMPMWLFTPWVLFVFVVLLKQDRQKER